MLKTTEWMAAARKRQGLPATIQDPMTLAKLAVLLRRTQQLPSPQMIDRAVPDDGGGKGV